MSREFTFVDLTSLLGDTILCDLCNADYTDSDETGGMLFGSYGVCPKCMPTFMEGVNKYEEHHAIKSLCPPDMSHRDFIYAARRDEMFPPTAEQIEELKK